MAETITAALVAGLPPLPELPPTRIHSSTLPRIDYKTVLPDRQVEHLHEDPETGTWFAFARAEDGSGEHIRASSRAKLVRRLWSLA